jgi:uncharacterized protein (DUF427 family)
MSLTTGRAPLSGNPAGRFNKAVPTGLVYVEPFARRVRGVRAGATVLDSERVLLVHRERQPPCYAFPAAAATQVPSEPEPDASGYVHVAWDAVDAWFEEEEQVYLHPRNPYHRVDCVPTSRRLRVQISGSELVDSTMTMGVYETSLAPRLYVGREHLLMDVLRPSATTTYCPYKGTAVYWSAHVGDEHVADVAWSYESPNPECWAIRKLLCFDGTKVHVEAALPQWPQETASG